MRTKQINLTLNLAPPIELEFELLQVAEHFARANGATGPTDGPLSVLCILEVWKASQRIAAAAFAEKLLEHGVDMNVEFVELVDGDRGQE